MFEKLLHHKLLTGPSGALLLAGFNNAKDATA